jgi:hypothetical protein
VLGPYSFGEVLKATAATKWELVSFLRAGVVSASVKDTEGPGDPRQFDADDVVRVRLALELKRLGIGSRGQQRFIRECVQRLIERPPTKQRPEVIVVVDPGPGAEGKRKFSAWMGSRDQLARQITDRDRLPVVGVLVQVDRLIEDMTKALGQIAAGG